MLDRGLYRIEGVSASETIVLEEDDEEETYEIEVVLLTIDDIMRTGADGNISVHFVGSIVYIEKGQFTVAGFSPLLVIDGQQRLSTVILLIAALANALEGLEPIDGFSQQKLRNRYLLNPGEDGEQHFKLILSQTDKTSLISILDGTTQPQYYSLRVTENFHLFDRLIRERKDDLATVCKGLAKLMVVDIALTRDRDHPQLIFESMNSTGRELSQADLIRNYILMGLEPVLQTKLYERYWRPMEVKFGQEAYVTHFDGFMRYFLTVKTGALPKIGEVLYLPATAMPDSEQLDEQDFRHIC